MLKEKTEDINLQTVSHTTQQKNVRLLKSLDRDYLADLNLKFNYEQSLKISIPPTKEKIGNQSFLIFQSNIKQNQLEQGSHEKFLENKSKLDQQKQESYETRQIHVENKSKKSISFAQRLYESSRVEEAKETMKGVIKDDHLNVEAYYILVRMHYVQKEYDEAIQVISEAVEHNPAQVVSLFNLGVAFYNADKKYEAAECFKRAIKFNPIFTEAIVSLGFILNHFGYFDQAIQLFKRAENISNDSALLFFGLGYAHRKKNQYDQAEIYYQKTIEIDPHFYAANFELGMIYYYQGKLDQALDCITKTLQNPEAKISFAILGHIFASLNRPEESYLCFKKAIELMPNPKTFGQLNEIGTCYRNTHLNPQKALQYYFKAFKINPQSAQVLNNIGMVLIQTSREKQAIQYFQKALQIDPNFAYCLNNIGCCFELLGFKEKAIQYYRRAIECDSLDCSLTFFNLGDCLLDMGYLEQAKKCLKKCVEVNPRQIRAYNSLGLAYSHSGESQIAISWYLQAIHAKPNDTAYFSNLRAELTKMKDFFRAVGVYQQLFEFEIQLTNQREVTGKAIQYLIVKYGDEMLSLMECWFTLKQLKPHNVYDEAWKYFYWVFMLEVSGKESINTFIFQFNQIRLALVRRCFRIAHSQASPELHQMVQWCNHLDTHDCDTPLRLFLVLVYVKSQQGLWTANIAHRLSQSLALMNEQTRAKIINTIVNDCISLTKMSCHLPVFSLNLAIFNSYINRKVSLQPILSFLNVLCKQKAFIFSEQCLLQNFNLEAHLKRQTYLKSIFKILLQSIKKKIYFEQEILEIIMFLFNSQLNTNKQIIDQFQKFKKQMNLYLFSKLRISLFEEEEKSKKKRKHRIKNNKYQNCFLGWKKTNHSKNRNHQRCRRMINYQLLFILLQESTNIKTQQEYQNHIYNRIIRKKYSKMKRINIGLIERIISCLLKIEDEDNFTKMSQVLQMMIFEEEKDCLISDNLEEEKRLGTFQKHLDVITTCSLLVCHPLQNQFQVTALRMLNWAKGQSNKSKIAEAEESRTSINYLEYYENNQRNTYNQDKEQLQSVSYQNSSMRMTSFNTNSLNGSLCYSNSDYYYQRKSRKALKIDLQSEFDQQKFSTELKQLKKLLFNHFCLLVQYLSDKRDSLSWIAPHYFDENKVVKSNGSVISFELKVLKGITSFKTTDPSNNLLGRLKDFQKMITCLINGIIELQRAGIFHEDLQEWNIFRFYNSLKDDYSYKIIDFDWAFKVNTAEGDHNQISGALGQNLRNILELWLRSEETFAKAIMGNIFRNIQEDEDVLRRLMSIRKQEWSEEEKIKQLLVLLEEWMLVSHRRQLQFQVEQMKHWLSRDYILGGILDRVRSIGVVDRRDNETSYEELLSFVEEMIAGIRYQHT